MLSDCSDPFDDPWMQWYIWMDRILMSSCNGANDGPLWTVELGADGRRWLCMNVASEKRETKSQAGRAPLWLVKISSSWTLGDGDEEFCCVWHKHFLVMIKNYVQFICTFLYILLILYFASVGHTGNISVENNMVLAEALRSRPLPRRDRGTVHINHFGTQRVSTDNIQLLWNSFILHDFLKNGVLSWRSLSTSSPSSSSSSSSPSHLPHHHDYQLWYIFNSPFILSPQ